MSKKDEIRKDLKGAIQDFNSNLSSIFHKYYTAEEFKNASDHFICDEGTESQTSVQMESPVFNAAPTLLGTTSMTCPRTGEVIQGTCFCYYDGTFHICSDTGIF